MPAALLVVGVAAVSLAVVPNPLIGQSYHHSVFPEDGLPPNTTVHEFQSLSDRGRDVLISGTNGSRGVTTDRPVPEFDYGYDHSAWTFVSMDGQVYVVAATTGNTTGRIARLAVGFVGVVVLLLGTRRAYRYWVS
ncbi:MAG: hypothetical protein ABEJ42_03430 [Halobacteriaceae archaeon]